MGAQLYAPYHMPLYLESGGFGGGRGDFGNGGGGSKCYKCNRYYEKSTSPFNGTLSFTDVVITLICNICVLTRFGHFARECREEEDRCYKCHGNFLN